MTRLLATLVLCAAPVAAAAIRAGTDLTVRVESKISTATSKPGEADRRF
jgi:hypothetical protein